MHFIEYLLSLAFDLDASVLSNLRYFFGEGYKVDFHLRYIYNHHHGEETLYDCLGNVHNVNVILCKIGADLCDDTDCVFADYGYDSSIHFADILYMGL